MGYLCAVKIKYLRASRAFATILNVFNDRGVGEKRLEIRANVSLDSEFRVFFNMGE